MNGKKRKQKKERSYAIKNYIPQPEDFYGLFKLYEFREMQALDPSLWDNMMAYHEAVGDVEKQKFGPSEIDGRRTLRTYRDKSTTITAVLALHVTSRSRKGLGSEKIAEELSLKSSYVESIVATYKPLPKDPSEVISHFPIEFVMWCPPGETVEIYWRHNPPRGLDAKRRQEKYIKELKEQNFPMPDILNMYKLGYRIGDDKISEALSKAEKNRILQDIRTRYPIIWRKVMELHLGNIEALLLTDKMANGELSEQEAARFIEVQKLVSAIKPDVFVCPEYEAGDGASDSESADETADEDVSPEDLLLQLLEAVKTQRVCHLLRIEMKYLKVTKSLVSAMA